MLPGFIAFSPDLQSAASRKEHSAMLLKRITLSSGAEGNRPEELTT
jgi:hypothetical protein